MNVYDFDKTIYAGDSTLDFYIYCLKKYPRLLAYLFIQVFSFIKYNFNLISKDDFKETFYGFLKKLDNPAKDVEAFWQQHQVKLQPWYLEQKLPSDYIISASPEFLLHGLCAELGVTLIASKVELHTGKLLSPNCYGSEKVSRFREMEPTAVIGKFYSDSTSDKPLADLAEESFLVKGNDIKLSNFEQSNKTKVEFVKFLIIGVINTFNGALFASLLLPLIKNSYASFIGGYMIALVISYLLNSSFVFKQSLSVPRFIKFFISYIPNFLIQNVIVGTLLVNTAIPPTLIYVLSSAISVPITFILLKIYAMK